MAGSNSLSVTAPALVLNGQPVASGLNFDLEMPNLSDLINQSFGFVNSANSANDTFLTNVINQSNASFSGWINQTTPLYQSLASDASQNEEAAMQVQSSAQSNSGGGGGLCFVTTAVCEAEGKADDCEELQLLRHFRDTYMLASEGGRVLVRLYYRLAPVIVERINAKGEYCRRLAYSFLREYIGEAIARIKLGDLDGAALAYCEMLEFAAGVVNER